MRHTVTVLPGGERIPAEHGAQLLRVLRLDAPCGGRGTCGKCRVNVDGKEVLACRIQVTGDMTVTLPEARKSAILETGMRREWESSGQAGYLLALDIGTTTVVGYLLEGSTGRESAVCSLRNPQTAFGADVISRIQYDLKDKAHAQTAAIREAVDTVTRSLCREAGVGTDRISRVSLVGNPAMQQLFLGLPLDNLARIPFDPVLTRASRENAGKYLSVWKNAELLTVPDISGFVGADTVACVLATELDAEEEMTLLVDIGTNAEMVLGNKHRTVACAAAAGPALEGANISCGMRGETGAVDHVWLEAGKPQCSVIGGGEAGGICGSGLIDAVAAALDMGLLDSRGRIQNEERIIRLTDRVFLTQEDIRQVQLAKGAIAAGVELMAAHLGIGIQQIGKVYLAGAFGTFLDPASACRIGLLPMALAGRITAVGNAAGSGAKRLVCENGALDHAQALVSKTQRLELASVPGFQRCFARNMRF